MNPLYIVYRRCVIVELLTLFSVLLVFSLRLYEADYSTSYSFSLVFILVYCVCAASVL